MPHEEAEFTNRRDFARSALQSLTTLVLIEGLWSRRLLGADVRPIVDDWFKELNTISRDVHEHRTKDVEYQQSLERLYQRVDLAALLKTLDFDRLAAGVSFPAKGAKSLPVDFSHVGGLPVELAFGRQIFAMGKGRSVVPHGHDNMATGFLVLKGNFPGPALRPHRRSRRPLHHPADDRPRLPARPVLDDLRPQGQCPLVHQPRVKPALSSTSTWWRPTPRTPNVPGGFTSTRWARSSPAA